MLSNAHPISFETTEQFFVFDSLNDVNNLPYCQYLLQRFYPEDSGARVEMVSVQQQQGATDCGLFALAFTDLLCREINPGAARFNQSSMRETWNMFETTGQFNSFSCEINENHETTFNSVLVTFDTPPLPRSFTLNRDNENIILN